MRGKESATKISLVDVMYGVVLAYGFSFFDRASTTIDYIRFFFAYTVIIIDWIYVHSLYWGWEYKYNSFLLLDMGILFTISRLLHTSTSVTPHYLLWLSILFMFYFIWDVISKIKDLPSEYDWVYSMIGDAFAAIAFFVFWFLSWSNKIQFNVFWSVIAIVIYVIALLTWFKKFPKLKPRTTLK